MKKIIAVITCIILMLSTTITGVGAATESNKIMIGMKVLLIDFKGLESYEDPLDPGMARLRGDFTILDKAGKISYTSRHGSGTEMFDDVDLYDIVIIQTHGLPATNFGPCLYTGYSDADTAVKDKYEKLMSEGVVGTWPRDGKNIYLFTPDYFKKYVNFKNNSVVILLACDGAGGEQGTDKIDYRLFDAIMDSNKVLGVTGYYNSVNTIDTNVDTAKFIDLMRNGKSLKTAFNAIGGRKGVSSIGSEKEDVQLISKLNTKKTAGKEVYMQTSHDVYKAGINRSALYIEIVPPGMMNSETSKKVQSAFKLSEAPWHQIQTTLCDINFKGYRDNNNLVYKIRSGHGIEMLNNLKDYGIILISAYGNQLSKQGVVMWLGEFQSKELDSKYSKYLKEGSIVNVSGHYAITSKYIQKYVKFGENSIVLNMFNSSLGSDKKADNSFSQSEISNGAIITAGVVGDGSAMYNDFMAIQFVGTLVYGKNAYDASDTILNGYFAGIKYQFVKNVKAIKKIENLKTIYMAK